MTNLQKYLSTCLLAVAALVGATTQAWAQVPLGAAAGFSVLGGTNVTATGGLVVGNIGVAPGSAVPFTNTGSTITGAVPPATDAAAVQARLDFLSAYAAIQAQASSSLSTPGNLSGLNLAPGVYSLDAVAKAGTLTLTGPATGVWIFIVTGALTGTNFSVVMAGGGLPCNVFWATDAAATLTTSAFKGTILAGNDIGGSITLTGGSLAGRALANVAVTMTDASVVGCSALSPSPSPCDCDCDKHHENDKDDDDHDGHHRGDSDHDKKSGSNDGSGSQPDSSGSK
jgi:hypothetical protein